VDCRHVNKRLVLFRHRLGEAMVLDSSLTGGSWPQSDNRQAENRSLDSRFGRMAEVTPPKS